MCLTASNDRSGLLWHPENKEQHFIALGPDVNLSLLSVIGKSLSPNVSKPENQGASFDPKKLNDNNNDKKKLTERMSASERDLMTPFITSNICRSFRCMCKLLDRRHVMPKRKQR